MDKIYVVTEGCYSDYHIVGVYTDLSMANEAARCYGEASVEEYEPNPNLGHEHPSGMDFWCVSMDEKGDTFDIRKQEHISLKANPYSYSFPRRGWAFYMWAKDQTHAVKIANERRIQLLAHGIWDAEVDYSNWQDFADRVKNILEASA